MSVDQKVKLTTSHKLYELALRDKEMWPTIAWGSAGTGKTYMAVGFAVEWVKRGKGNKVVVIRPPESFTKGLGYLPGTLREKLQPWVNPIQQAFISQGLCKSELDMMEKRGKLEYVALEYIQGLTFDNTLVIVDEAQNATFTSMKMLLTRMGKWSKIVLCGDTAQTAKSVKGGLGELVDMVVNLNLNCHVIKFSHDDILRSKQVKDWLVAFDKWEGE